MTTEPGQHAHGASAGGITPESIARYRAGAPEESAQFDFFVGSWEGEIRAATPDGGGEIALPARWQARWVHGRRMLVDDLTIFAPDGTEIAAWLNLRTFCPTTGAWEITGQRVLEPVAPTRTVGRLEGGEMHLRFETADGDDVLRHHVRFFEISNDGFEWVWSCCREGDAERWRRLAAFSARRVAESAA